MLSFIFHLIKYTHKSMAKLHLYLLYKTWPSFSNFSLTRLGGGGLLADLEIILSFLAAWLARQKISAK